MREESYCQALGLAPASNSLSQVPLRALSSQWLSGLVHNEVSLAEEEILSNFS